MREYIVKSAIMTTSRVAMDEDGNVLNGVVQAGKLVFYDGKKLEEEKKFLSLGCIEKYDHKAVAKAKEEAAAEEAEKHALTVKAATEGVSDKEVPEEPEVPEGDDTEDEPEAEPEDAEKKTKK